MPSDWQRTTLGKIAIGGGRGLVDGPFGSNLPASDYVSDGVPVIRGSNLTLGGARFVDQEFVFVTVAAAERLARSLCESGDIIFTKKGTLGQTGIVPSGHRYPRFLLSSNQMKLTVDRAIAEPLFVYYYVSSEASRAKIVQDSTQTGVPKTNVAYLKEFPIFLPSLREQRLIAALLNSLDDKIEQNRRTGRKLEELARAVFKAWFVDFEPVRAKAAGATAFPGMPPETFATLPNAFQDSPLGPIPLGWEIATLRELATLVTGGTPSKKNPNFWNGAFPWVSAKDMHGRIVSDSELRLTDAGRDSVRRLAPRHATLMVIRGMSLMKEVRIGWCTREVAFNQDLRAFIARDGIPPEFIHLWLTSSEEQLMQMVDTASHGTGRILTDRLDSMTIARPSDAVMQAFADISRPIMALRETLHTEAAKLAALRDYLLPKLLSGQVRVRDAERRMEAAS